MIWLKIPGLAATTKTGHSLTSSEKYLVFGWLVHSLSCHKHGWKCPLLSLKKSSGVTLTNAATQAQSAAAV